MSWLAILLLQLVTTAALTGLIWTVQLVQYPGFAHVPESGFRGFHDHHTSAITRVVLPLMAAEALVALFLLVRPPPGTPAGLAVAGFALVGVSWLSTALVQVPLHRRLASHPDAGVARRLVRTNWIRTAAWSARCVLAAAWILAVARVSAA